MSLQFQFSHKPLSAPRQPGFTLIELLIVVSIIAILAAIAVANLSLAQDRALKSADAANMKSIATALQNYFTDYSDLPPADREAGPFASHTEDFSDPGNGPAAGGSWDGLPWLLVDMKYVSDWRMLFTNRYMKWYSGGETIRGGHPRFHNFRYAYNSAGLASGGHAGGDGNVMSGTVWIVRNTLLPPQAGFYAGNYPGFPADYTFPWGEGDNDRKLEHVLFSDMAVRTVVGGTSTLTP